MTSVTHEIISTEKVPFTYRVAGIGARFLAWLLDVLLLLLIGFGGMQVLNIYEQYRGGLGAGAMAIWAFVLNWGYFVTFEWLWAGQTPGKRTLGIRVIHERGTGISFFQAAVRNLVRFVDALPVFYGLGFVVMACNVKHRRLGDWAAGTLVVHVERKAKPIYAMQETDEASRLRAATARQRLGQLSREQKQTLLDLCLRRDQLRIDDRARLFRAVSEHLQQTLDLAPDHHQSDEKFLVSLVPFLTSSNLEQEAKDA